MEHSFSIRAEEWWKMCAEWIELKLFLYIYVVTYPLVINIPYLKLIALFSYQIYPILGMLWF